MDSFEEPFRSVFPLSVNFNKNAIEIFIGYRELQIIYATQYHNDHASKSGLQPSRGELLIFYLSLEGDRSVSPSYR